MNTKKTTSKAVMGTAASEARRSVLGGLLGWHGRAGRQFVWSVCCFVVALLAASVLVAPSGAAGTDEAGGQAAEPDLAGTGQAAGQVAEPDSAKADEIGEAGGAVEPVVPVASVVRVGGSGVAEGGSREFRVGLSAAAAEVVKVSYSVVAGSSTASVSDYVLSPAGSVTFAAGEVSKTVTLVAVDDAIDEPGEVVTLGLLAGSGYAVSSVGGSAEVKILDNDAPPVASISSGGSAVEGDEVVLTVSLSAASGYGLSVPYGVVAGSSTASSSDYVLSPAGAVVFAAGETSKTVTVATVDDDADEPDEQVTVQLGAGSNYAVSSSAGSAVVWVKDNDEPAPPGPVEPAVPVASIVRAGGSGVAEGGSREFTVGLSAAAAAAVTVAYSVAAASSTAGVGDYVLSPAGSVTFAAGETAKTVTITAVDDAVDEPGEVVTLGLLAGSGYAVSSAGGSAEVKILDNDAPPVASISSGGSAVEGSAVSLTVSLSAPSGYGLSVPYSVVAGSTTAGSSDYVLSPAGAVVFAAGETSKTVTVATVDDEVDEPDEQVTVQLGVGYDYAVSSVAGSAVVWIRDNDEPAPVTTAGPDEVGGAGGSEEVGVTGAAGASEEVDEAAASLPVASIVRAGAAEVTEGDSRDFTVSLSAAAAAAVTVAYSVVAASSTAKSSDYSLAPAGQVVFDPGETSKTVVLAAVDDASDEPAETVTVGLSAGSGYSVSSSAGSAVVSIADNDAPPLVSIRGGSVVEGSAVVWTVSLSWPSGYDLSVPYGVVAAETTAEAEDYGLPAGPVAFAPGETSKTVTMTTVDDELDESPEKVTVLLGAGSNYMVSSAAGSAVGWIRDNDAAAVPAGPVASIFRAGAADVTEGQSRSFRLFLFPASADAVVVAYGVVAGSSTAKPSDYALSPTGSVMFAPGETSKTVTLAAVDDLADELGETVTVGLLAGGSYVVSPSAGSASVNIVDNDAGPVVSVFGGSGVEGSDVSWTVSLAAESGYELSVPYSVVAAETTAEAEDYGLPAGPLVFAPGETSKTITMTTVDDELDESPEKVTVLLGSGSNYTVSDTAGSAAAWINDNDSGDDDGSDSGSGDAVVPVVTVEAQQFLVAEGNWGEFVVSLSVASADAVTVAYSVGGADGPLDYSLPAGPLVFAPGETSKTLVLTVLSDSLTEPYEAVVVELLPGSSYTVGSPDDASILIFDNVYPYVSAAPVASVRGGVAVEGSDVPFTVSLSRPLASALWVPYSVVGAATTAGPADYSLPAGSLEFAAGETSKTLVVTTVDDVVDEPAEKVTVRLVPGSGYTVSSAEGSAAGWINDNDAPPVASLSGGSATEGSAVPFTVGLSAPSGHVLSVPYSVVAASTTAGPADYFLPAGPLVFAAGETVKTIDMLAFHDGAAEQREKVTVRLGAGSHYAVSSTAGSAVGWIDDNAAALAAPVASIARAGSYDLAEGQSRDFTVSLSAVAASAVTVAYSVVADATTAETGDYALPQSGSVTFAAGETAKTVTMTTADDSVDEPDEVVVVGLLAGSGYAVSSAAGSAAVSLLDNDAAPVASLALVGSDTLTEGQSRDFTVSLSAASEHAVTVGYSAWSDELAPPDYSLSPPASVVFAPGETAQTFVLATTDDSIDRHSPSALTVGLLAGSFYTVSSSEGPVSVSVQDNDGRRVASISGGSATEGSDVSFTVRLSRSPYRTVTVPYSVVAGSTTAESSDYSLPAGPLVFAAGETAKTITMTTVADGLDESPEKVTVQLGASSSYDYTVSSTAGSAVGWIHDQDDAAPAMPVVTISKGFASRDLIGEGGGGSFSVRLSQASASIIAVPYRVAASSTADVSDYSLLPAGAVVFAPGETHKSIAMVTVDDALNEPDESVTVELLAGSSYKVDSVRGSVSWLIQDNDDDAEPVASISGGSAVEGSDVSFTVSLSRASGYTLVVPYSLVAGATTAASSDYALPAGPLVFAPGETAKTVIVATVDDTVAEPAEKIVVQLGSGRSYSATLHWPRYSFFRNTLRYSVSPAAGSAAVWIHDNDRATAPAMPAVPVASIVRVGAYDLAEGQSRNFTVSLSPAADKPVTVAYSVAASSTAGASDRVLSPASQVVFAPGQTARTVALDAVDDASDEPDETVTVGLLAGSSYTVSSTEGSASANIVDNDDVTLARIDGISAFGRSSATEGSELRFTVSLSAASGYTLSVPYSVVTGWTEADASEYSLPAGSLVFAPGETVKTVIMTTADDAIDEPNEKVWVRLGSGANYTLGSSSYGYWWASGTIRDNDGPPVASISGGSATEGSDAVFAVSLSAASGYTLSVPYSVLTDETTAEPADYSLPAGPLVFAPGETVKTITMTAADDLTGEPDEQVTVQLDAGSRYTVSASAGSAIAWIHDNEHPRPVASLVRAGAAAVAEGQSRDFTVSLAPAPAGAVTVAYRVVAGSTTAGSGDYRLSPAGAVTFAPGETSKTVVLAAVDDLVDEPDETVTLELSPGSAYTVSATQDAAAVSIVGNDTAPVVSIFGGSAVEGSAVALTVSLSAASGHELSVPYSVVTGPDATTAEPADYSLPAGPLVFAPGETVKPITMTTVAGAIDAPAEQVTVRLGAGSNYTVSSTKGSAIAWINDNGASNGAVPVASLVRAGAAEVAEGQSRDFTVSLSPAPAGAVTVAYSVAAGSTTAGSGDYRLSPAGAVTFAPGETSKTVVLAAVDDLADEPDETVTLELSPDSGYTVSATDDAAAVSIVGNDTAPVVSIFGGSAVEGSAVALTVSLSAASGHELSVPYSVVTGPDATTAEPADYSLPAGPLVFAPGETVKPITMTAVDDIVDEPTEQVTVQLDAGSNYTVSSAAGSAAAWINDNDAAPTVSLARAGSGGLAEGDSLDLTVSLSPASQRSITVHYSVAAGLTTAAPSDYSLSPAGPLVFAPGETTKTVVLSAVDDFSDEPAETVAIELSAGGTDYARSSTAGSVSVTLEDNDTPPVASISGGSAVEGSDASFTVRLSQASGYDLSVPYSVVAASTTAELSDYRLLPSRSVTFAPGETAATIAMATVDDSLDEAVEYVALALGAGTHYAVSSFAGSAFAAIRDNDAAPVASIAREGAAEVAEGSSRDFTVSLSVASGRTVTVPVGVRLGSGVSSGDYELAPASQVEFAAGETSQTVTLSALADGVDEPVETLVVELGSGVGYAVSDTVGSASVQVTDGDAPPVVSVVETGGLSVSEGSSGSFTLRLSAGSQQAVLVPYLLGSASTAVAGDLVFEPASPVRFEPGETEQTVTFTAVQDRTAEQAETAVVELQADTPAGSRFAVSGSAGSVSISIADNASWEPLASLARVGDAQVTEGESRTFRVTLSPEAAASEVTVGFEVVAAGTQAVPGDYSFPDGWSVKVPAGQRSADFSLAAFDDMLDEAPEQVTLRLVSGSGYELGSDESGYTAEVSIADNDPAPVASVKANSAVEGSSGSFTVSLSVASGRSVTVPFGVGLASTATATADYTLEPASEVVFAPGETAKTVALVTVDDGLDEPDESVVVVLLGGFHHTPSLTDDLATALILDDDPAPVASIEADGGGSVAEGDRGSFTVSLSAVSGRSVTVPFSAGPASTATATADYTLDPASEVVFAPGETARTIALVTVDDRVDEPAESVVVTLAGGFDHTVGSAAGSATAQIVDDDELPVASISAEYAVEGSEGSFAVKLSTASVREVTVPFRVVSASTARTNDYSLAPASQVVFAPGQTEKTIVLSARADSRTETQESVVLRLEEGTGYTVSSSAGVGVAWIRDAGAGSPVVSINRTSIYRVPEGQPISFTVALFPPVARSVTVPFSVGSATTLSASDYELSPASPLVFAAGETQKTISLTVTADSMDEPNEQLALQLPDNPGARYEVNSRARSVTVWIMDDDPPPVVSVTATEGLSVEEGGSGSFTVNLSHRSQYGIRVGFGLAGAGTASSGDLEFSPANSVRFGSARTSKTVDFTVTDDSIAELDETAVIALVAGSRYSVSPSAGSFELELVDNDTTPPVASLSRTGNLNVLEGASRTFTASLSGVSKTPVTVGYGFDAGMSTAAASDFGLPESRSVTFEPGETSKSFSLAAVADGMDEPQEKVVLRLVDGAGYTVTGNAAEAAADVRIHDLDPAPTALISAVSAAEGEDGSFTVSLLPASGRTVTVPYSVVTAATTATAVADYTLEPASEVVFAPGETVKTVTLDIVDDSSLEPSEKVTVELASGGRRNYTKSSQAGSATAWIWDNDSPANETPVASISAEHVLEGSTGSFTITLSEAPGVEVTVPFSVVSVSTARATGSWRDYSLAPASEVVFAADETEKTVELSARSDSRSEAQESVVLRLGEGAGYTVSSSAGVAVAWIRDAGGGSPVASISRTSIYRVTEGQPIAFVVSLFPASASEVTVPFSVGSATTLSAGDYSLDPASEVVFAPGETQQTITMAVADDTSYEPDERLALELGAGSGYSVSSRAGSVSVWILDDDPPPVVSVTAADGLSVGEGSSGSFTVNLSNGSQDAVSVGLRLAAASTASADDLVFEPASPVVFAAGETSKTVAFTVVDDYVAEGAETAVVELTAGASSRFSVSASAGSFELELADNATAEPVVSLSHEGDLEVSEGSSRVFTVSLSKAAARAVTVGYEVVDTGTTASASDFSLPEPRSAVFAPGETTRTFELAVADDSADEPDEQLALRLVGGAGYTLNTNAAAVAAEVTVRDNDPVPAASLSAQSAAEGSDGSFTVSLSAASGRTVTVPYSVVEADTTATATVDYTLDPASEVVFAPGETVKTVTLDITDDTAPEESKKVTVELAAGAGRHYTRSSQAGSATAWIWDDDSATEVSISRTSAWNTPEGQAAAFEVTVSPAPTRELSVPYTVSGAGITTGDYAMSLPSPLAFEVDQASLTLTLTATDDTLDERDYEPASVTLGHGNHYTLGAAASATTWLADDDAPPEASLAARSLSITEGSAAGSFTVSLSAASGRSVTVPYAITADGDHTMPEFGEYALDPAREAVFAPGETTQTVTVTPADDTVYETAEHLLVELAAGTGYTLDDTADSIRVELLADNDPAPALSLSPAGPQQLGEGETLAFTVSLSQAAGTSLTANLLASGAAGTSFGDYTLDPASEVVFAPGETRQTVTLSATDDALHDPGEQVTVTAQLSLAGSAGSSATVTITDNDDPPEASIVRDGAAQVTEGSARNFTVSLSEASGQQVTVPYSVVAAATNAQAADYRLAPAGEVVFEAGETTQTVTLTAESDSTPETYETVRLALSAGAGHTVSDTAGSAEVTIIDTATARLAALTRTSAASVAEGQQATFTIELSAAATTAMSVPYAIDPASTASPEDYTLSPAGAVPFAAGDTTQTLTLTAFADGVDEPAESVQIVLLKGDHHGVDPDAPAASVQLTSADAVPAASIVRAGDLEVTESESRDFTVSLSHPSAHTIEVPYAAAASSTAASDDYTLSLPSPLVFAPGETTQTLTLTAYDDTADEPDETVTLTLTQGAQHTLNSAASSADATIIDNDDTTTPEISISSGLGYVLEGQTAAVTVTLSAASSHTLTVPYTIAAASTAAATDYTLTPAGQVVFTPGETQQAIAITAAADRIDEPQEQLTLALIEPAGNSSYTLSQTANADLATMWIFDTNRPPTASISYSQSPYIPEGSSRNFTITLSGPSSQSVTVPYTVAAASTAKAVDYKLDPASQATFEPGETTKTVTFTAETDTITETTPETVTVELAAGSGYTTSSSAGSAEFRLLDSTATPVAAITRDGSSITPEGHTRNFTVTLSHPSTSPVTVNYTASTTDAKAADYTLDPPSRVEFAANETEQTIAVAATADQRDEPTYEQLTLTLTTGAGYTVSSTNSAAATSIRDEDQTPTASIARTGPASPTEGQTTTFKITLTVASAHNIEVPYAVTGGTATLTDDYTLNLPSPLRIPAGQKEKTLTLTARRDNIDEPDETLTLAIGPGPHHTVSPAKNTAQTTVADTNTTPAASVTFNSLSDGAQGAICCAPITPSISSSITEGDRGTFTVTLGTASTRPITVPFTVTRSDTLKASEYTLDPASQIVFEPGETRQTITLETDDDDVDEPTETLTVTFANGTGYTIATPTVTIRITDNDTIPEASIERVGFHFVTEGQTRQFAIELSRPSDHRLTIPYIANRDPRAPAPCRGTCSTLIYIPPDSAGYWLGTQTKALAADYSLNPTSQVVFEPGQTRQTLTLTAIADNDNTELEEKVTIYLRNGSNYTVESYQRSAGVTIVGDASQPVVSLLGDPDSSIFGNFATIQEGTSINLTVALSKPATTSLAVPYTVTHGDDTSLSDYSLSPRSQVTFAPGETRKTITVTAVDDGEDEPDANSEQIVIILSVPGQNPYEVSYSYSRAILWITERTVPDVSVTADKDSAGPGETVNYTVELSEAVPAGAVDPVVVNLSLTGTVDGDLVNGSEYDEKAGIQVTFWPGEDNSEVVSVTLSETSPDIAISDPPSLQVPAPSESQETTGASGASGSGGAAGASDDETSDDDSEGDSIPPLDVNVDESDDYTHSPTPVSVARQPLQVAVISPSVSQEGPAFILLLTPDHARQVLVKYSVEYEAGDDLENPTVRGRFTKTVILDPETDAFSNDIFSGLSRKIVLDHPDFDGVDHVSAEVSLLEDPWPWPRYRIFKHEALNLEYSRPEIEIVGFEVTQGTQDWKNSVELVRGRSTAVRVFFSTEDERELEVTAKLAATQYKLSEEEDQRVIGTRVIDDMRAEPESSRAGLVNGKRELLPGSVTVSAIEDPVATAAVACALLEYQYGDDLGQAVRGACADPASIEDAQSLCDAYLVDILVDIQFSKALGVDLGGFGTSGAGLESACEPFAPVYDHEFDRQCADDGKAIRTRCRTDIDSSLNFVLPPDWTYWEADDTSDIELALELVEFPDYFKVSCSQALKDALAEAGEEPAALTCSDPIDTSRGTFQDSYRCHLYRNDATECPDIKVNPDGLSFRKKFEHVDAPKIVLAKIRSQSEVKCSDSERYYEANQGWSGPVDPTVVINHNCPQLEEQYRRIHTLLPLPDSPFSWKNVVEIPWSFNVNNSRLLERATADLSMMRDRHDQSATVYRNRKDYLYAGVRQEPQPRTGSALFSTAMDQAGLAELFVAGNVGNGYGTAAWYAYDDTGEGEYHSEMNAGPHLVAQAMGQVPPGLDCASDLWQKEADEVLLIGPEAAAVLPPGELDRITKNIPLFEDFVGVLVYNVFTGDVLQGPGELPGFITAASAIGDAASYSSQLGRPPGIAGALLALASLAGELAGPVAEFLRGDGECLVTRGACGSWSVGKYEDDYSVKVSELGLDQASLSAAHAVLASASEAAAAKSQADYELPLLGPLGDAYAEVWGLDLAYLQARTETASVAGAESETPKTDYSRDQLIVSNPRHVYELMSYCHAGLSSGGSQAGWLGKDTHQGIMDFMQAVQDASEPSNPPVVQSLPAELGVCGMFTTLIWTTPKCYPPLSVGGFSGYGGST